MSMPKLQLDPELEPMATWMVKECDVLPVWLSTLQKHCQRKQDVTLATRLISIMITSLDIETLKVLVAFARNNDLAYLADYGEETSRLEHMGLLVYDKSIPALSIPSPVHAALQDG